MGQPYVGEIRMFGGSFAPAGWLFCQGQLLPISENETLFQLIGTTYGGDGESTFALPNLQGRIPLHQGNGFTMAEASGVEQVTLTGAQVPIHSHPFLAANAVANDPNPANNVLGESSASIFQFQTAAPTAAMAPGSVSPVGGGQPHTNFQPYLCISFIISLYGIFPSPT